MGRRRLHEPQAILDAARTLVLDEGAPAATIEAIARTSGAPIGSIYHSFGSRDALLAQLWIRAVRRSQERFLQAIENEGTPVDGAVAAALSIYDFAREAPGDARLLASVRREDLVQAPLPAEVATELEELNRPIERAIRTLTRRLFVRGGTKRIEQTTLAVFDLPYGALRRHLIAGKRPPAALRRSLARAVRAALEGGSPNMTRTSRLAQENSDVVQRVFAAVGRLDIDALLAQYAPEVVVREPPSLPHGGEHRGLEQVRAAAIAWGRTWLPYQVDLEHASTPEIFALSDDRVAARWRLQATGDRGQELDVEVIELYRLKDRLVRELDTYYQDTAAMTRFLEHALPPRQATE
jgi:AcrR family transcriptional regulator/ketosteroid isomerase-like protein